jgi:hypothetical protein
MPTEFDLLKKTAAMVMALQKTIITTPELEELYLHHLEQCERLLNLAHGSGILRAALEQSEDTDSETGEAKDGK